MTKSLAGDDAVAPNAYRLLWAGFMAILAAGVGYSVRGGILGQWADQFGFTMTELGTITGGGLTGFGIVIILSSLLADKIGYGKLMMAAFVRGYEEPVLQERYGASYDLYRRSVRAWIPRLHPWTQP